MGRTLNPKLVHVDIFPARFCKIADHFLKKSLFGKCRSLFLKLQITFLKVTDHFFNYDCHMLVDMFMAVLKVQKICSGQKPLP